MNKYEAMFIINPNLSEEERTNIFNQIGEAVSKNKGEVSSSAVWAERRKLYFTLKKHQEGLYYLVGFSAPAEAIKEIRRAYQLNENILRALISRL